MKILGIDTSGNTGTVAVVQDGIVLGEYTMNFKKTHSQTLMVMVDQLLKLVETDISEIDAFAISEGPGSFTGIRIGSATAKGFGLALNKPLINVPTLMAMAYNFEESSKLICPIMDARRGQVYCGIYRFDKGEIIEIMPQSAMAMEELINLINGKNGDVIFLGDGVPVHKDLIEAKLVNKYTFAAANNNLQRGSSVALLGEILYKNGESVSADEHAPIYLRVSQAERERAERLNQESNNSNND